MTAPNMTTPPAPTSSPVPSPAPSPEPTQAPVASPAPTAAPVQPTTVSSSINDYIPSNWDLKQMKQEDWPDEDVTGLIEGINNVTAKKFKGTVAQFNDFLRGVTK